MTIRLDQTKIASSGLGDANLALAVEFGTSLVTRSNFTL